MLQTRRTPQLEGLTVNWGDQTLMEKEIWHGCVEIAVSESTAWETVSAAAVQQREKVSAKGSQGKP